MWRVCRGSKRQDRPRFGTTAARPTALRLYVALALLAPSVALAQAYSSAKTPEGVHRKAVITVGDGKLYTTAKGSDSKPIQLMDVYFILEGGEAGDRLPVSFAPDATKPDGWLTKDSFAEWNAVQMVDFAAQGGRTLVEVQESSDCAIDFAKTGRSSCKAIGSEPDRQNQTIDFKMLVPVFSSQAKSGAVVYEGGFVRVTPGAAPKAISKSEAEQTAAGSKTAAFAGYELIFAVDSTVSMAAWFRPTLEAIGDFVAKLKADLGSGEVKQALRIGLLFYQDRKVGTECSLDYITQWRVQLSDTNGVETIDETIAALANEREAKCGSDESNEAVWDALNRAILDPKWKDGSFRVVALVGDAPPHSEANEKKNPLRLGQAVLHKMADERNVRFLSTFIESPSGDSPETFLNIALQRSEALKGRFAKVQGDPATMRRSLGDVLWAEWTEIVKPARIAAQIGATKKDLTKDRTLGGKINPSDYAYPIILNMLPDQGAGSSNQSYSKGWIPQKVLEKSATSEYVFISRPSLRNLMGVLESIQASLDGKQSEGPEAFIDALRAALASQLKVRPEEVFAPGEPLSSMLKKARVLPFDTGILRFTDAEIRQWRPEDYARVLKILDERLASLRQFQQFAGNVRQFGTVPHFFVPQSLFP